MNPHQESQHPTKKANRHRPPTTTTTKPACMRHQSTYRPPTTRTRIANSQFKSQYPFESELFSVSNKERGKVEGFLAYGVNINSDSKKNWFGVTIVLTSWHGGPICSLEIVLCFFAIHLPSKETA